MGFTNSPKLEDHLVGETMPSPSYHRVCRRELPEVYEGLCHVGLYSSFIVEGLKFKDLYDFSPRNILFKINL